MTIIFQKKVCFASVCLCFRPAVSSVGASSVDPFSGNDDYEDAGERYEMVVRIP